MKTPTFETEHAAGLSIRAEAHVGELEFGIQPGDLVFVHAGTPHRIVNRAAAPLRLVAVLAPPEYPAAAVLETPDDAAGARAAAAALRAR